eukprot:TRINITY_DN101425_c0_g1_i1.p1 TRINITY_DN101425_c0_g1~~TRINITY_DN101425_c0_g1_i1.p1  ORF type:complete len:208 (+),score=31.14 TRINITY_DN101425_c0_g1_i1:262-885(+)
MVAEQLLRDPAVFQRARACLGSCEAAASIPSALELIDEYLANCLVCDGDTAGELFSVWEARNVDVVLNHLRSMLIGAVGKDTQAEDGTELLLSDAWLRPRARHVLEWWRLQQASSVATVVDCFQSRRDTLADKSSLLQGAKKRRTKAAGASPPDSSCPSGPEKFLFTRAYATYKQQAASWLCKHLYMQSPRGFRGRPTGFCCRRMRQ